MRCPMGVLLPGRDFAWFPLGNDISLSTWHRLLLFRRLSAGCRPDSSITTPRLVVRKFPVTALPSWLSSLWSSSRRSSPPPLPGRPTTARPRTAPTLAHRPRAPSCRRPAEPVRRCTRCAAVLAFFILPEWCSLRVNLESTQTPSHRAACWLKGTSCLRLVSTLWASFVA